MQNELNYFKIIIIFYYDLLIYFYCLFNSQINKQYNLFYHSPMNYQKIQYWQSQIREIEHKILKYNGPSIALFSTDTQYAAGFQMACSLKFHDSQIILINKDSNAKIKSFYFCLLQLIQQNESNPYTRMIQIEFKQLIYSLKYSICIFPAEQIPNKFRSFYNEKLLMKLLVQFFHIIKMEKSNYSSLSQQLNKYPIIDMIFTLLIRAYLINTFHLSEYLNMNNVVQFQYLQIITSEILKVPIKKVSENEIIFQMNQLQIRQQHDFIYIRKLKQKLESNLRLSMSEQHKQCSINNLGSRQQDGMEILTIPSPHQQQQLRHSKHKQIQINQIKNFSIENHNHQLQKSLDLMNIPENTSSTYKNIHESIKLSPTISEPKTQFEFDMYDGITSPQVLKYMSKKVVEQINKKKQMYIQKFLNEKLCQKIELNKKKTDQIQIAKTRIKKRYSMISAEQIQEFFDTSNFSNNYIEKNHRPFDQKNIQVADCCEELQTNNTFRYSHQTEHNSLLHHSKLFSKYHHHPPVDHYAPLHLPKSTQLPRFSHLCHNKHKHLALNNNDKINQLNSANQDLQVVDQENKKSKTFRPKKLSMQNFSN